MCIVTHTHTELAHFTELLSKIISYDMTVSVSWQWEVCTESYTVINIRLTFGISCISLCSIYYSVIMYTGLINY